MQTIYHKTKLFKEDRFDYNRRKFIKTHPVKHVKHTNIKHELKCEEAYRFYICCTLRNMYKKGQRLNNTLYSIYMCGNKRKLTINECDIVNKELKLNYKVDNN